MKKLFLFFFLLLSGFILTGCDEESDAKGTITVIVVNYEQEEVFNGKINFQEDDTLLGLLQEHEEIRLGGREESYGFYITTICGINAEDYPQTFWMIEINGVSALVGISDIPLKDKDEIKFSLINW
ncbi:MAG TPA: DUF4430 domain-containing protein [Acholeplasmataceae bacterium]|jgi:hypothetical protein|nr:DUF4430 domain-containing protein [Acholeplasmataceae bacterium]